MVQNGPNDHFGQNDLIPNWILAFDGPKWSILVHSGLKRSSLVHLGPPPALWPFLSNGGFQSVVRVWSGEQIPTTPYFRMQPFLLAVGGFLLTVELFYLHLTTFRS